MSVLLGKVGTGVRNSHSSAQAGSAEEDKPAFLHGWHLSLAGQECPSGPQILRKGHWLLNKGGGGAGSAAHSGSSSVLMFPQN